MEYQQKISMKMHTTVHMVINIFDLPDKFATHLFLLNPWYRVWKIDITLLLIIFTKFKEHIFPYCLPNEFIKSTGIPKGYPYGY